MTNQKRERLVLNVSMVGSNSKRSNLSTYKKSSSMIGSTIEIIDELVKISEITKLITSKIESNELYSPSPKFFTGKIYEITKIPDTVDPIEIVPSFDSIDISFDSENFTFDNTY